MSDRADGSAEAPADMEIVTTRVIDAPRELVFRAWSDPDHLAQWWGPKGYTNTFHEFDPRPGGAWRFVMHGPDGVDHKNESVFVEILKPERIVIQHVSAPQFQITATFAAGAGKTRLAFESGTREGPHMFRRIDHVEIVTDQVERTVEFYTGVLGFTVRSRDRIDGSHLGVPMGLVYLDLGGTTVELISYEGASVEPAPVKEHLGYWMMALEVDDMQATVEYLGSKGVAIVWGPKVREKYARAEICDPNGYHIELRQWFP